MKEHVIVTGGSRGIGFAVARAFASRGAKVLILARNAEELSAAAKNLADASGEVMTRVCDVAKESDVEALKSTIETDFENHVDVLVNAAGIYGPMGLLEENDIGKWRATFEVNVFGTMFMCRLVLPFMKKKGSGRIITFSGGGEGAFPRFTAYSSSKGAILRFTESLAAEVQDAGITVNAIAPGAVNTSLMEEVLAAGKEKVGDEFYAKSLEQKDSGGVSPEKAAELILFLCSEKATKITGKVLSAVHDKHEALAAHAEEIVATDIYSARRIKPKDRGFDW